MDKRPIGVFDSGLGGLTVLHEMKALFPNESFVYFGDCGRIPYGTKSRDTVSKYTIQDIQFLLTKDVKMIVIACNTASAYGYEVARQNFDIPIFEVVSPGARAALDVTRNGHIGVIGTQATISTGVYEKAINRLKDKNAELKIFSKKCPLFVSLAEEGWWDNDIAGQVAGIYLEELKNSAVDTLILGCTHYPLLHDTISKVMGEDVKLVSSGKTVSKELKAYMEKNDMCAGEDAVQQIQYYTSDSIQKFIELGESFLGEKIHNTYNVEIDKF